MIAASGWTPLLPFLVAAFVIVLLLCDVCDVLTALSLVGAGIPYGKPVGGASPVIHWA